MRAIIRVMLLDTTDEEAIEIKKQVQKVLEKTEDAEVEITIMAR